MYNYTLTRLAYWPVFVMLFVSGICTGSVIALLLRIFDHSIDLVGATFLAVVAGLLSGLVGLVYTAVFNTLAPSLGGLPIKFEPLSSESPDHRMIDPPDLPSY